MKIVFVSDAIYPYMHGGKEKRLYELSTRLAKQGHDVHIYTMHWWKNDKKSVIENGVNLHAISKLYKMYSGDRRTIKEGILFGLSCFKLYPVKFDVIDVDHMPFFPVVSVWVICITTFRYRKFYGTWHEALKRKEWVNYMGYLGNIASLIERICAQLPYKIITSSEHTKQLMPAVLGRKRRLYTVTPGIDYFYMQNIKPAKSKSDIIVVCRLVKDKNIDVLIDAVGVLKNKKLDVSCVIVGTGPEKKRLLEKVKRLELSKNIKFIDKIPDAKDLYSYIKSSKVFCLPSVREGFGIVVLEALACGIPVVTIDSPANASRYLIKNDFNGSIVTLKASKIADSIDYWISKRNTHSFSEEVSEYDWDSLVNLQEKVYTQ